TRPGPVAHRQRPHAARAAGKPSRTVASRRAAVRRLSGNDDRRQAGAGNPGQEGCQRGPAPRREKRGSALQSRGGRIACPSSSVTDAGRFVAGVDGPEGGGRVEISGARKVIMKGEGGCVSARWTLDPPDVGESRGGWRTPARLDFTLHYKVTC